MCMTSCASLHANPTLAHDCLIEVQIQLIWFGDHDMRRRVGRLVGLGHEVLLAKMAILASPRSP